jgi:20S proteasome subunit beta 1
MCVITEEGVERLFVSGDQLPKFWEGREVLALPGKKKVAVESTVVPMAVEV